MLTYLEKKTLFFLMRQGIYFTFLILCALSMWGLADIYHAGLFEEYGVVENMEVVLLLGTFFVFGVWLFLFKKDRILSLCLMVLPLAAACRELDAFFDELLPVIGWRFAWIFPVSATIYALFHFNQLRPSLVRFINSPAFYLMMMAMVIIVPIAQCIGHKNLIISITGTTENARILRRLFEESIELEGYFLIFFSSFEYYFSFLKSDKH